MTRGAWVHALLWAARGFLGFLEALVRLSHPGAAVDLEGANQSVTAAMLEIAWNEEDAR